MDCLHEVEIEFEADLITT